MSDVFMNILSDPWLLMPYIAAGFAAQVIDGALGMAFGVISTTMLVSVLGVPPAQASASVHLVEMFTTGASGISHAWHKNIDWKLFSKLVIPGMIGGAVGAYLLASVDAAAAKPFVMIYLAAIGLILLYRGIRFPPVKFEDPRMVAPLAVTGGFLDAAGGGGWGPVVTSNLLIQGTDPRKTIGTVNASEFFLTLTISATFIFALGLQAFTIAAVGLLIGGLAAAPFGALILKRVQPRWLLLMVGVVLTASSAFSIYRAWG